MTDKSGNPVLGLQQQDFTLLDNKQPPKILSLRAPQATPSDPPVKVVLVIDEVLRKAQITRYSVDPLGTSDAGGLRTIYYQTFLKGARTTNQVQIGDLGLQVLARQSGGLALNSSNDVAGEIAQCVAVANAFYALTFETQPGDGPNDYHSLEVKVDRPKVTAHTRTGYYAQPEPVQTR